MKDNILKALDALKAAAESGKMTPQDYFEIGMIAGRNQKPQEPEKKTA